MSALGASAVLFEAPGEFGLELQSRIWGLARRVAEWPDVAETCPGVTNLTVVFRAPIAAPDTLSGRLLAAWSSTEASGRTGRHHRIPVRYDGQDLEGVAAACGLTPADVVARHAGRDYAVYAIGSHPGFGYLGRLDEALVVPRRAVPILSVPAGSVAVAGLQTAVFASDGPTGWHVIGHTDVRMFDPLREPPALLEAGDTVRFVPTEPAGR